MSRNALFYNSENNDRIYDADDFSDWLKKFFTTGVFQGDLQVTANNDMTVNVNPGYANVKGKVMIFETITKLNIETANATYDRIDTIVVERNDSDRDIKLKVVKGGYSSNPVPTAPIRNDNVYQLVLAQISVIHGATSIAQSVITDKRTDTSVCGLVVTPIDNFDFNQFATQFNAYFNEFKNNQASIFASWTADQRSNYETWISTQESMFTNWSSEQESDFETWSTQQKADFEAWEVTIRNILDQGAAGNLQNEIDAINNSYITNSEIDSLFE